MQKKFLWVLHFRQVGDLPDIFQNHTSKMIFFKIDPKLGENEAQLEETIEVLFFLSD